MESTADLINQPDPTGTIAIWLLQVAMDQGGRGTRNRKGELEGNIGLIRITVKADEVNQNRACASPGEQW